jgi:hypothetical protein
MNALCLARLHRPSPAATWNAGYYVTRCCRCGADLIRRPQAKWRTVPKGYRIVWTPRPADHPDWAAFAEVAAAEAAAEAAAAVPPAAPAEPETPAPKARMRLVCSAPAGAAGAGRPPTFREWRRVRSA